MTDAARDEREGLSDRRTAVDKAAPTTSPFDPPDINNPVPRPNGGGLMFLGVATIVLGVIFVCFGVAMPSVSSPGHGAIGDLIPYEAPTYNEWKWPMTWLGAALVNVGVLAWALGLIVRALFFIPGRTLKKRDLLPPHQAAKE